jgi:hypothetical protein
MAKSPKSTENTFDFWGWLMGGTAKDNAGGQG